MSLIPRLFKEFGFDHQFTISVLYLEKNNNTCFAGVYRKEETDYFCISGTNYGFIYFPLDYINMEKLVKNEISLLRLILISRRQLRFSNLYLKNQLATCFTIFIKCKLKKYNKIPNGYYIWHDYLQNKSR